MTRAAVKRAIDVAVPLLVLLLLAPVLLAVALAIRLGSPGPVLFRQQRIGRGGRPFRIFKFRTMVVDAERLGPNVSATRDPRITAAGRVLRACFLDEVPQLLNVLRGEMSLVGPRPETPEYVALLGERERRLLLAVRPGMAGPSTLAFSGVEAEILAREEDPDRYFREVLLHQRVAADLRYVERGRLRDDARILAGTAWMVIAGAGRMLLGGGAAPANIDTLEAR